MEQQDRFLPSQTSWPLELGLMLVVGVFFTLTGLFQSDQAPLPVRMVYWCCVMVVGGGVLMGTELVWSKIAPARFRSGWMSLVPVILLATTPQFLVVLFFESALFRTGGTLVDLADLWLAVMVVVTPMVALLRGLRIYLAARPTDCQEDEPGGMPDLIRSKLAKPLQHAELIALEAEDHYVRVHTSAGSELILMRFGDALASVASLPGYRLHRSWWASGNAIEIARYSRGTGTAELTGGITAPISRSYAEALKQSGVLAG